MTFSSFEYTDSTNGRTCNQRRADGSFVKVWFLTWAELRFYNAGY